MFRTRDPYSVHTVCITYAISYTIYNNLTRHSTTKTGERMCILRKIEPREIAESSNDFELLRFLKLRKIQGGNETGVQVLSPPSRVVHFVMLIIGK